VVILILLLFVSRHEVHIMNTHSLHKQFGKNRRHNVLKVIGADGTTTGLQTLFATVLRAETGTLLTLSLPVTLVTTLVHSNAPIPKLAEPRYNGNVLWHDTPLMKHTAVFEHSFIK